MSKLKSHPLIEFIAFATETPERWREVRRAIGRITHAAQVDEARAGLTQLERILEKGYTEPEDEAKPSPS